MAEVRLSAETLAMLEEKHDDSDDCLLFLPELPNGKNQWKITAKFNREPYVGELNIDSDYQRTNYIRSVIRFFELNDTSDPKMRREVQQDLETIFERDLLAACNEVERKAEESGGGIEKFTFEKLREQYPTLRPPVVDGLFREGETVNLIADSKSCKSWMMYALALSIIDQHNFLGTFPTTPGRVLLLDNELHRETLADRIPKVANALGVPSDTWEKKLEVWPLRGRLQSLSRLSGELMNIKRGDFKAIIFDAKYRLIEDGASETANEDETRFYNLIDQIGAETGAASILVHHTTKGTQSDKKVTDVGSGAGAMGRAADCHAVLRAHEQEGCYVFEAKLRSFASVEPLVLRWDFPLWHRDDSLDPKKLKGRTSKTQQAREEQDQKDKLAIVNEMRKDGERVTSRQLRTLTGLGKDRLSRLLDQLQSDEQVLSEETIKRGNPCYEYWLPQ